MTPTAQVTYGPGRYHVRLEVVDGSGLSSWDRVEVVVAQAGRSAAAVPGDGSAGGRRRAPRCHLAGERERGGREPRDAAVELQRRDDERLGEHGAALHRRRERHRRADGGGRDRAHLPGRGGAGGLHCGGAAGPADPRGAGGERALRASLSARGAPQRLAATGDGPLRWSLVDGPEGMALDESTGALTWVPDPRLGGTAPLTVAVEGAAGRDARSFEIPIDCRGETGLRRALRLLERGDGELVAARGSRGCSRCGRGGRERR